jgi:hypothetical protein
LFFCGFHATICKKNGAFLPQLIVLGTTFLGIGLLNDITYILLANKIARILNDYSLKLFNKIAAINLIVAGFIVLGLQNLI